MAAFLAPLLASTALSAGQGYMANRAAERQEERMRKQAAQDKLIQSFSPGAQPTPVAAQQPGVTQQMLSDPITKQLLSQLIGKGIGALTNRPPTVGLGGGGGVQNVASPFNYMTP
jgi:7-keto-8-aminopelargonate synthetase-like enzyme